MESSLSFTTRCALRLQCARWKMIDRGHFTAAIALARKMLDLGVDPNAVDSFGNNALLRAPDGFSSTPLPVQVFLTVWKMRPSIAICEKSLQV